MARTVDIAREIKVEANREAPAWLAWLDLACATAAALLWVFVPELGAYPLILASVPVAIRLLLTGRLSRRTPFDVPLGLFLITAGLAVWSAYDREAAWAKFWLIAGGILLYYALANATVLGKARAWLPAFLGAMLAVYFVITNDWGFYPADSAALTLLGETLQSLAPAVAGPRLNPNEVGGILAMLLPFAAWVTWDAWRMFRAGTDRPLASLIGVAAGSLMFVMISLGLAMTGSRGAWLALGVGLYAGGTWLVAGRLAGQHLGRRLWVWICLLVLGAFLGVLAVVVLGRMRLWGTGLLNTDSLSERVEWYRYMFFLAKDYIYIGAGLDNFLMLYATYALLLHVGYIFNAHNLYLGVAIAQGLPGLLALVWMWVILALLAWRHAVRADRLAAGQLSPASSLAGGAALFVGIVLVHGLLESALYGTGVFLLFVPLAFALSRESRQAEPVEARRHRPPFLALGALLTLALVVVLVGPRALLAQFHANLGAVYQSQAELSVYTWPEWYGQDDVRSVVDLQPAVDKFEQALALEPSNGTANRRLGQIELSLGEYGDALRHLQAAYVTEGWSVTTRQLLGEALIVNGYVAEGRALWAEVNNEQLQLVYRAEWYEHIGDQKRESAVRLAAGGQ